MNFGFDMVYLGTNEAHLQTLKGWGVRAGNRVGDELEGFGLPCADGYQPKGAGYFINRGKGAPNQCSWTYNSFGLFAQVNPSTLKHEYHLTSNLTQTKEAVQHDMGLLGIDLDVDGLSVNRVDITKQSVMKHPVHAYTEALTSLNGKRMKSISYPSGYTFGNKQKEAVFYDKTTQLRDVKRYQGDIPPNLLRCEVRWKKRKVIGHDTNGLGKGDFASLISMHPEEAKERYNNFMERQIFRREEGQQLTLDFETEVEVLRQFVERKKRGGWKEYFMSQGIESIFEKAGSMRVIESMLFEVGYSREQVHRNMKEIRNIQSIQGFMDVRRGRESVSSTIEVLRQTFAA